MVSLSRIKVYRRSFENSFGKIPHLEKKLEEGLGFIKGLPIKISLLDKGEKLNLFYSQDNDMFVVTPQRSENVRYERLERVKNCIVTAEEEGILLEDTSSKNKQTSYFFNYSPVRLSINTTSQSHATA